MPYTQRRHNYGVVDVFDGTFNPAETYPEAEEFAKSLFLQHKASGDTPIEIKIVDVLVSYTEGLEKVLT